MKTTQAIRTSTTTYNGEKKEVKHTEPQFDEIVEKMGKERVAKVIIDTLNRHHFLPAIRAAGDVVGGTFIAKTDKGKEKELERATEIDNKVEAGEVFDIWEFLPDERESVPAELKPYWDRAKTIFDSAKDDDAMKAKAVAKFGEFTVRAIAQAAYDREKAMPSLF